MIRRTLSRERERERGPLKDNAGNLGDKELIDEIAKTIVNTMQAESQSKQESNPLKRKAEKHDAQDDDKSKSRSAPITEDVAKTKKKAKSEANNGNYKLAGEEWLKVAISQADRRKKIKYLERAAEDFKRGGRNTLELQINTLLQLLELNRDADYCTDLASAYKAQREPLKAAEAMREAAELSNNPYYFKKYARFLEEHYVNKYEDRTMPLAAIKELGDVWTLAGTKSVTSEHQLECFEKAISYRKQNIGDKPGITELYDVQMLVANSNKKLEDNLAAFKTLHLIKPAQAVREIQDLLTKFPKRAEEIIKSLAFLKEYNLAAQQWENLAKSSTITATQRRDYYLNAAELFCNAGNQKEELRCLELLVECTNDANDMELLARKYLKYGLVLKAGDTYVRIAKKIDNEQAWLDAVKSYETVSPPSRADLIVCWTGLESLYHRHSLPNKQCDAAYAIARLTNQVSDWERVMLLVWEPKERFEVLERIRIIHLSSFEKIARGLMDDAIKEVANDRFSIALQYYELAYSNFNYAQALSPARINEVDIDICKSEIRRLRAVLDSGSSFLDNHYEGVAAAHRSSYRPANSNGADAREMPNSSSSTTTYRR